MQPTVRCPADPAVQILVASTLTQRNADVTLKALSRGAADYIPKPAASRLGSNEEFRRQLVEKVLALGASWQQKSNN